MFKSMHRQGILTTDLIQAVSAAVVAHTVTAKMKMYEDYFFFNLIVFSVS